MQVSAGNCKAGMSKTVMVRVSVSKPLQAVGELMRKKMLYVPGVGKVNCGLERVLLSPVLLRQSQEVLPTMRL
jgi:hypothetical protein